MKLFNKNVEQQSWINGRAGQPWMRQAMDLAHQRSMKRSKPIKISWTTRESQRKKNSKTGEVDFDERRRHRSSLSPSSPSSSWSLLSSEWTLRGEWFFFSLYWNGWGSPDWFLPLCFGCGAAVRVGRRDAGQNCDAVARPPDDDSAMTRFPPYVLDSFRFPAFSPSFCRWGRRK